MQLNYYSIRINMSILTLQEVNDIGNASWRYVFKRDWLVDFKKRKQCADRYSKK